MPDWRNMTEAQQREYHRLKLEEMKYYRENKIETMYPETGPLRRELYAKQMEFFAAGKTHRERCLMAANRVGKTEGAGGPEAVWHASGLYPPWWVGKVIDHPCQIMASGDTGITTRDIIQDKLFGDYDNPGEGLVPRRLIGDLVPKAGIPRAYDNVKIKHVSGGWSQIFMRSYESGRKIFQGTELDVFWADEECPLDVYSEGLMRLLTTNGIAMLTFTPLSGLTELVLSFLGDEFKPPEQRAEEGF